MRLFHDRLIAFVIALAFLFAGGVARAQGFDAGLAGFANDSFGDTEKAIATVDADGVSLAAIKALIQRTTQLRKENDDLKAMLADLAQRLSQLEQARR